MSASDPRVDAYIAKSADFAQPILRHLRRLVHQACPDVTETIKWSMPFFDLNGPLCHMAAFKQHAAFGFWQAKRLPIPDAADKAREAMGSFGRLASLADLPADEALRALIAQAAALNRAGIKAARPSQRAKPTLVVPDELTAALERSPQSLKHFVAFTPGKQREYADWIAEAKTTATKERRVAQAIEWLADGKPRHWKHASG